MMGRDRRAGFGWSAVAALALAGAALLAPATASARGYTGAQAEAQGDTAQDPYSFPAIKLCCEKKKKPHHGHHGHWGHNPGTPPDGAHRNVAVNCAMPTSRESFGSMREALDYMRGAPGRISVVPGAPCDISGLSFGSGVVVTTANYGYGVRARVGGASCAQVSAAGAAGAVTFGGIDVEACFNVRSGELNLDEVNLSWRGQDSAILVNGGSLTMRRTTVRAKDAAVYAIAAGRVWIDESRLATTPAGPFVIRLNAANINLVGLLVKGAKAGVVIDGVRDALQLSGVTVVRSEPEDPYPPFGPGDHGILIGGGQALNDLPWLSGLEARRVVIKGANVTGYENGITLGSGTSVVVESSTVNGASYGISAAAGAFVTLQNNKVRGSKVAAISLQAGARGQAESNSLHCARGDCVCYSGDCTSRSNYVFAQGAFRMRDTDCDD
jgi:hypothetical protein